MVVEGLCSTCVKHKKDSGLPVSNGECFMLDMWIPRICLRYACIEREHYRLR